MLELRINRFFFSSRNQRIKTN